MVRPRVHNTHFHGVYAAHATWRAERVPRRVSDAGPDGKTTLLRPPPPLKGRKRSAWCPWSELLERVFGTGGFMCPRCGGQMTLRTVVVGPPATTRILAGLRTVREDHRRRAHRVNPRVMGPAGPRTCAR